MSVVTFGPRLEERLEEAHKNVLFFQGKHAALNTEVDALTLHASGVPEDTAAQTRLRIARLDAAKAKRDASGWQKKVDDLKERKKMQKRASPSPQKAAAAAAPKNAPVVAPRRNSLAQPGHYYQGGPMSIYRVIAVNLELNNNLFYAYVPMKAETVYNVPNAAGKLVNITRLAVDAHGAFVEEPVVADFYTPVWPTKSPTDKKMLFDRMAASVREYDAVANVGFETASDFWK
jgi:hypothetical protein